MYILHQRFIGISYTAFLGAVAI